MEGDDEDLVREARGGRPGAFEELVRRHQGRVLGLCAALVGRSGAEDAAQEAFLKAYRSLEDFRGDSSFATWLHRIASNQCLDLLRRESRRGAESLDELLEREGERLGALLRESGPESSIEARDLAQRLLACLPPEQRLALTLREYQGLSYEEIARVMECSLDSVKARLKRAREALEERLRHFLGDRGV